MEPAIRELTAEEWPEAARVCGRAIWNEPYMVPAYGEEPLGRFAATIDSYLARDVAGQLVLGGFAGPHVVAVVAATRPDSCRFCTVDPSGGPPSDSPEDISYYQMDVLIQREHRTLARHWRVGPLAVEPGLQGVGLGRRLMDAFRERAWSEDRATIVLECDPRVVAFYERLGYREVSRAVDPDGIELRVLTIDPV